MNKEIKLKSRDAIDNRLIQLKEDSLKYKLKSKYNYRVGFKDKTSEICDFIDPSGGPFIDIGSEVEGHIVKAIYKNGVIEFES